MLSVDLKNATLYPNIDEFFGFSKVALVYMYIASTLPDLFALVGNFIVLYTSLKYKSFNLNKITVTLLENLAVADLILIFVGLLPMDIIIFTKTWTLGRAVCVINGYFTVLFGSAEIYILVTISVYRLALLRSPFLLAGLRRRSMLIFMVCLWGFASVPTLYGILSGSEVYYDPYMLSCTSTSYAEDGIIVAVLLGVFLALPMAVIIIANTNMLVLTVRFKRKLKRNQDSRTSLRENTNALVTVGCVGWMFIISWIPYAVRVLAESQSFQLPKWFYIFQTHVLRLNVFMNPIIYTCTNRSFKECVKTKIIGKAVTSLTIKTTNSNANLHRNPIFRAMGN